ncbi:YnfA family protein [Paenalcaligenes hominis]|uniref:YnfA family protein n=1 Tax=Paenalcaligenes hominis TaxID=643674 RepID=UPI0035259B91
MTVIKTVALFAVTAIAEIVGCYLPYLWLKEKGSPWLLLPTVISLALFIWLLSLHPAASGRVYAAYGGVYVVTALLWLRVVDGASWSWFDLVGAGLSLLGMVIIVLGWSQH